MGGSRVRAWRRTGAFLFALALLAPCLFPAQYSIYRRSRPRNGHLIRLVPFETLLQPGYCGPACLTMALRFWDASRGFDQQAIADRVFDRASQGTHASDLLFYARTQGFAGYSFEGTLPVLKDLIRKGVPVIVLTSPLDGSPQGHFRLVIGFDDDLGVIVFHDACLGSGITLPAKAFERIWARGHEPGHARWAMVLLPTDWPAPIPELENDPQTAIDLAMAYHRRNDHSRSREQWQKVLDSCPRDPLPRYSLAMLDLEEGRTEAAEALAAEALRLDTASAHARDALGIVYAFQGKIDEALGILAQALHVDPKDALIRDHYLAVRAIYVQKARLDAAPQRLRR